MAHRSGSRSGRWTLLFACFWKLGSATSNPGATSATEPLSPRVAPVMQTKSLTSAGKISWPTIFSSALNSCAKCLFGSSVSSYGHLKHRWCSIDSLKWLSFVNVIHVHLVCRMGSPHIPFMTLWWKVAFRLAAHFLHPNIWPYNWFRICSFYEPVDIWACHVELARVSIPDREYYDGEYREYYEF